MRKLLIVLFGSDRSSRCHNVCPCMQHKLLVKSSLRSSAVINGSSKGLQAVSNRNKIQFIKILRPVLFKYWGWYDWFLVPYLFCICVHLYIYQAHLKFSDDTMQCSEFIGKFTCSYSIILFIEPPNLWDAGLLGGAELEVGKGHWGPSEVTAASTASAAIQPRLVTSHVPQREHGHNVMEVIPMRERCFGYWVKRGNHLKCTPSTSWHQSCYRQ